MFQERVSRIGKAASVSPKWRITYLAKLFKVPVDYLCGRTDERYRVKLLDNIDFDLTKLNGKGIEMLCEYYDYLVSSKKYRAK